MSWRPRRAFARPRSVAPCAVSETLAVRAPQSNRRVAAVGRHRAGQREAPCAQSLVQQQDARWLAHDGTHGTARASVPSPGGLRFRRRWATRSCCWRSWRCSVCVVTNRRRSFLPRGRWTLSTCRRKGRVRLRRPRAATHTMRRGSRCSRRSSRCTKRRWT